MRSLKSLNLCFVKICFKIVNVENLTPLMVIYAYYRYVFTTLIIFVPQNSLLDPKMRSET